MVDIYLEITQLEIQRHQKSLRELNTKKESLIALKYIKEMMGAKISVTT